VYLMAVQDELDMYPEMHTRTRHWVPLEEAFVLSKHAWMHDALQEVHALVPSLLAPYPPVVSPVVERKPAATEHKVHVASCSLIPPPLATVS
jgi:hypothetical protein